MLHNHEQWPCRLLLTVIKERTRECTSAQLFIYMYSVTSRRVNMGNNLTCCCKMCMDSGVVKTPKILQTFLMFLVRMINNYHNYEIRYHFPCSVLECSRRLTKLTHTSD